MSKELDLGCFSYVASARVLGIEEYPKPNYGAEVKDVIDTLAADAPMVAVAASHLGLNVGLVGNAIGTDSEGNAIIERFNRNNINLEVSQRTDIKTPFIVVLSDKTGNREWFPYLPNVAADLEQINLDILGRSSLAYIDYYQVIQSASLRAIDFAKISKIPSFVNLGGTPLTPEIIGSLSRKDIAIVQTNLDEQDAPNAGVLAQTIMSSVKPEIAIVTLGSKGAVALKGQELLATPAQKVSVRHLHGAGATFSAGFAYGYLKNMDIKYSLRFACALGSMNCTVETGFDAFSVSDVEEFLKQE